MNIEFAFLTYNNYDQIVKCFESLKPIVNRYNIKVNILDNGSTDKRIRIYLEEYRKNLNCNIYYSPTNLGCAGGRSKQWNECTSKYIIFFDSDVIFPKNTSWLQKIIGIMENDPKIGLIGPQGGWVKADWSWFEPTPKNYRGFCDVICGFCQIVRKSIAGIDRDQHFNPYWHEDSDFCFQILNKGYKIYCLPLDIEHNFTGTNRNLDNVDYKTQYLKQKWQGKGLTQYEKNKIPNKIFFIFGFGDDDFYYPYYLAVKSAFMINHPADITIYYYNTPNSIWWKRVQQFANIKKIIPPEYIFGNKLYHYAHQADIVRLQKLIENGGIYLDIDTLCLKSFKDLLDYSCVMGTQQIGYGICNAIILAEKNSSFLKDWLKEYKSFRSKGRDQYWDEHSVQLPLKLVKDRKDICILKKDVFFPTAWNKPEDIFINRDLRPFRNTYCLHLWDTSSKEILKTITPSSIKNGKSAYDRMALQFIKGDL